MVAYRAMGKRAFTSSTFAGSPRNVACLLVLFLIALEAACNKISAKDPQAQGLPSIPVKVETARLVPISDSTEYVATLKSRDSAIIMPQVEGHITEIHVRSGDHVSRGALLMEIDPSKQQATVNTQEHNRAAQEANLKWAQEQYDRISALAAAGVVSKQDLDQARSARDNAQAQLRALDAQLQEQQVQLITTV